MLKKLLFVIALLVLSLIAGGAYYLYIVSAPAKEEKIVFDTTPVTQEAVTPTIALSATESGTTSSPPRVKKSFAQFVPTFREVDFPFTHRYDKRGLPALGSSLIDVDGDGVEEVFIGGGYGQADGLFYFKDGKFEDRIGASGLSGDETTYGSFVVDSDSDADSDILISREDGIYLYRNDGTGKFSQKKLDITLEKDSVVLQISGGDIDRDGILDLYLSTFIDAAHLRTATFNDSVHAKANILLRGKGDDIYEDITEKAGAVFDQNTFVSSLVDLDGDGYPDIVIAPNTEKVTIYKNNGNLTFTRLPPVTGYGFWMGLALGDIDNDRDIDIFVSNMGNTIPVKSARGDLRADQVLDPEWRLIENLGNMQFQDATEKSGLLGYEFAWGAIFEDWNLDSHLDLIVAENYIKWPPHKINKLAGRFFIGGADGKFRPTTTASRAENYAYGTTPLSSDFDADGYPDLIITNLDGKTKALLSDGGTNKSLRVIVPTSARYIGVTLTMMSAGVTELTRVYTPATGLYSSQSSHIIFPLAPGDSVESLSVSLTTGEKKVYDKSALDTMLNGKRFLRLPIF